MLEIDENGEMFVAVTVDPARRILITREGESLRIEADRPIPRWAVGEVVGGILEMILADTRESPGS